MRKLSVLLGVVGVIGLAGTASAKAPGWVTYRGHGKSFSRISFLHPVQWKARYAGEVVPPYGPDHSYLIVALSTEHLQRPTCREVPQPDGSIRVDCDPLLEALPLGGMFVELWDRFVSTFPDPTLAHVPGNRTRIDGVLAKIVTDPTGARAGGFCPKRTTGSVQVYIAGTQREAAGPGRGMVYISACTNTTSFPGFMARLLPMLRSIRIRT